MTVDITYVIGIMIMFIIGLIAIVRVEQKNIEIERYRVMLERKNLEMDKLADRNGELAGELAILKLKGGKKDV